KWRALSAFPSPRQRLSMDRQHEGKIQPTILHRRAPVVTTRDRPTETVERIHDAVFQANHPPHLHLKCIERVTEAQEHQPGLGTLRPGHRSPHHEGLRLETFLS